ncbi:hypothetical protein CK203_017895 [Vitis vinifera]|uniref:Uncharacterized protein n=1 Tax=Vitis vinifera TaxID=29760 RepID=A0A438JW41_VITVI|nr:hypothetical protein CK203_017895 [Vitis vinifera]
MHRTLSVIFGLTSFFYSYAGPSLRLYRTLCGWHIRLALELIFAILMNGICPGLIQNCGICPVDAHDHKERQ